VAVEGCEMQCALSMLDLGETRGYSNTVYQRGEFLDEIHTKVLRVFLLAIHSHLQRFAFFFKLTQPLKVSAVQLLYTVKEKEENMIEKHTPFPMV
jgi:hypothetical protein